MATIGTWIPSIQSHVYTNTAQHKHVRNWGKDLLTQQNTMPLYMLYGKHTASR